MLWFEFDDEIGAGVLKQSVRPLEREQLGPFGVQLHEGGALKKRPGQVVQGRDANVYLHPGRSVSRRERTVAGPRPKDVELAPTGRGCQCKLVHVDPAEVIQLNVRAQPLDGPWGWLTGYDPPSWADCGRSENRVNPDVGASVDDHITGSQEGSHHPRSRLTETAREHLAPVPSAEVDRDCHVCIEGDNRIAITSTQLTHQRE
jgi:hypothetical protein